MDFVAGLPTTPRKHNGIWVVMDHLTKLAQFIPVRKDNSVEELSRIYVDQIVIYHGTPSSIVSDHGAQFTSHFWKSLQSALGTRLDLSSAFHPQIDGQIERVNQVLEACLGLMFCISRVRGRIIYLWWSFPTTTATSRALVWHRLRLYMVDHVGHRCVGMRWVKTYFWDQIW